MRTRSAYSGCVLGYIRPRIYPCDPDSLRGWESESECRGGLSEGCPEGILDKKEGFEDRFWYLELKFGVDLLSTGHLSRLFDSATGSIKMRNHFPVILALLILYQLPYGATYLFQPKTMFFFVSY